MLDLKRHRPTLSSLALHAVLLLCLGMLSFQVSRSTQAVASSSPKPTIKAVAVDAKAVQQEVARIQSAEKQKAQAARRKDLAMRRRQARAAKALKHMQQKKRAMQRDLARAKQQKAQAQKALKTMQAKQQRMKTQAKREAEAAQKARVLAEARAGALMRQSMMDRYKAMIVEKIAHHWVLPKAYQANVSCRLRITLGANGEVLGASILKGSGYPALDASARAAVLKASPLPLPKDPALSAKFKVLRLTVKPEQLQNT